MALSRHTDAQLRQFASQLSAVSVTALRDAERFLPVEETEDFLHGLLCGLGVAYQATEEQRKAFGPVIAVLAERILKIRET